MWGLTVHSVVMFSCLTISVMIELSGLTSYCIDYQGTPPIYHSRGILGPWEHLEGSSWLISSILPCLVFFLNQWLADGLLVIYISTEFPW